MKTKKIIIIIAIVLAVPALFFSGFYAKGYYDKQQDEAAKKTARIFIDDLLAGDNAKAYALTSKSLRDKQNESDFVKAMDGLKSDNPRHDPAEVTKNGSKIIYTQKVVGLPRSSTGSEVGAFSIELTKDGTSWKVSSASVN